MTGKRRQPWKVVIITPISQYCTLEVVNVTNYCDLHSIFLILSPPYSIAKSSDWLSECRVIELVYLLEILVAATFFYSVSKQSYLYSYGLFTCEVDQLLVVDATPANLSISLRSWKTPYLLTGNFHQTLDRKCFSSEHTACVSMIP